MLSKIVLLSFLLCASSAAQVKFTSAYTSLGARCKTVRGVRGTDDASVCDGIGGYQVRVYGAAAAVFATAELKRSNDSYPLASASLDFDFGRSPVEWRLANGKPFAAILRIPKYGEPLAGEYFGKVIGQKLVVRGLKGFEELDGEVEAASPRANAKARELADNAFRSTLK